MAAFDWLLGIAEAGLMVASVVLLLRARSRREELLALVLAIGVALTLAHPFGMRFGDDPTGVPAGAKERDPTAVNVARVGGLPLMPFVLYKRKKFHPVPLENTPTADLKARSWVWPFLFIGGSDLASICSNDVSIPCWEPDWANSGKPALERSPTARSVSLWEKDGAYWAVIDNRHQKLDRPSVPAEFVYKIEPAVTSWWVWAYWLLIPGIVLIQTVRPKSGSVL